MHTTRIVEIETTRFNEDGENSRSGEPNNVILEKIRETFSITITLKDIPHEPVQLKIVEYQWMVDSPLSK